MLCEVIVMKIGTDTFAAAWLTIVAELADAAKESVHICLPTPNKFKFRRRLPATRPETHHHRRAAGLLAPGIECRTAPKAPQPDAWD